MRSICRFALLLVTAIFASSCGGAPRVANDWWGRLPPNSVDVLVLHLTQDNTLMQGTACWVSGGVNHVAFKNAQVTGIYPVVNVSVPEFNGFMFFGEFQGDGSLVGRWHFSDGATTQQSMIQGVPTEAGACR